MVITLDGSPLSSLPSVATANYGNFTALSVASGACVGLPLHLGRLARDSELLFGSQVPASVVRGYLRSVTASLSSPAMLRATIFVDDVSSPPRDPHLRVLVTTRPVPVSALSLRVRTASYVRDLPQVKHIGLFGATHQRRLARQAGFDDALFIHPVTGLVSEGPTWNVAVLLGDELVWPDDACLPGTTRALLQSVSTGWSVRSLTVEDLRSARAAYATSAGIGLVPITQIDGTPLPGDGSLLKTLQSAYDALPPTPL